jgi:hypothetical protein
VHRYDERQHEVIDEQEYRMKQLLNLSGWPPQGGAGPFDTRKEAFVNSPESVTLRRVDRIVGTRVDITCMFGKEVVTFRFFAADKGMAESVAELLSQNSGQSLRDLGMLYLAGA